MLSLIKVTLVLLALQSFSAYAKNLCDTKWWKEASKKDIDNITFEDIENTQCLHSPILSQVVLLGKNPDHITKLIKKGANPKAKNTDGETPLHAIAVNTKISPHVLMKAMDNLVKGGANIDAVDSYGETLLHKLASSKNVSLKLVDKAIELGANINAKDVMGRTPLHAAAEYNNNMGMINKLISYGANVSVLDMDKQSPLHKAAKFNTTIIIQKLISKGVKVNIKDKRGNTPLHLAAISNINRSKMIKLVVKRDGSQYIRRPFKAGPADILIRASADPNATNNDGRTPLHLAAKFNNLDFVDTLIKSGAELGAVDRFGRTPVDLAKRNRIEDVRKYLEYLEANSP